MVYATSARPRLCAACLALARVAVVLRAMSMKEQRRSSRARDLHLRVRVAAFVAISTRVVCRVGAGATPADLGESPPPQKPGDSRPPSRGVGCEYLHAGGKRRVCTPDGSLPRGAVHTLSVARGQVASGYRDCLTNCYSLSDNTVPRCETCVRSLKGMCQVCVRSHLPLLPGTATHICAQAHHVSVQRSHEARAPASMGGVQGLCLLHMPRRYLSEARPTSMRSPRPTQQ